jgi:hypothetical protein
MSKSALFPKRARDLKDQVEVHHEVLTRHAREFEEHGNWITGVHQRVSALEENDKKMSGYKLQAGLADQRVTALEKKDPSKELEEFRLLIGKVRAVMWTFGMIWTVLLGIAGIIVSIVLSR